MAQLQQSLALTNVVMDESQGRTLEFEVHKSVDQASGNCLMCRVVVQEWDII